MRRTRGRVNITVTLLLLAAFATAPGASVFADASQDTGPDVVALIVPLTSEAEEFGSVVERALDLRFDPPNLVLDVRALHLAGGTQPDNDTLVRQVGATTAQAILICRYSVTNGRMTAAMDWRDVRKGTRAAVSERQARVDLALGDFILGVLDALLAQVHDRMEQMAARRRDAAASTSAVGAQEPAAIERAGPATEDDVRVRRLLLSASVAPFIPVGAAGSSLGPGSMASAVGTMLFPLQSGSIGVGVSLGVVFFSPQGSSGITTSIFVPVGIDGRYVVGIGGGTSLVFRLNGGAAVLVASGPSTGSKAKTVPFAGGAVGVEVLVSRTFAISLEAGSEVYFEMPTPIIGVSPSLEVSVRL